jgi:subtilisin family serine protease
MRKTIKNFGEYIFVLALVLTVTFSTAAASFDLLNFSNAKRNEPLGMIWRNNFDKPISPDLPRKFEELMAKAQQLGSVRIIVGFRLEDYRPDAELNDFGQTDQRAKIKEMQSLLLESVSDFAVSNVKQFDYIPFMALEVSAEALAELRRSPEIISLNEDGEQRMHLLQSVPLIGGPNAWAAGFTGQGRTVAILDTGVDKTHPFFNNRIVSEACYSTNSGTISSFCPGGVSSSTAAGSGINCSVSQIDGCSHGTHVAGIAAGGNPQINGAGVAKNANIIAMQVFSRQTNCGSDPSPCATGITTDQISALERVYALRTTFNIDAVNLSLGSGQYTSTCDTVDPAYKTIIDNLRSAGIATVISSGNNGYSNALSFPACISTAISVGSTHDGSAGFPDIVSDFSNSAIFLTLLAPGEVITSSVPGGTYGDKQGTSQAAPHVAGAFAVLKQKFPTDTVTQILTRLKYSGVMVFDPENGIGKPRIKIDTALNTSNVDPCGTITPITTGQTVNGSLNAADCLLSSGARADIFSFTATQGQTVAISHSSSAFNTYLFLFNSAGTLIAQDDNGGGGTNSRIPASSGALTIPASGTYYIYASALFQPNGNYTLTFTGSPSCSFAVSSSTQNFAAAGGNGNFNVTAGAGCAWTAQSNATWLTTSSTGNGNGTVNYAVAQNATGAQRTATITVGSQTHTVTQAAAAVSVQPQRRVDYDGDGKTDISIFRPGVGQWWYLRSSDSGNRALQFGASTDKLVPADFTGDGKTDIAFFRPSNGSWFILRSEDGSFFSFPFGAASDIPFAGDFDADGKADPGVFRPSTSEWYILKSTGGTIITSFGANGDKPVVADYDGDGKTDIAIYRPSLGQWWIWRSGNNSVYAFQFGLSTDKPVVGDYTGDGKADAAFWRASDGFWYIVRSEDSSFYSVPFGLNGDQPSPGDYDGDGKFDTAVFRPSSNTWYIQRSTAGILIAGFGAAGDLSVPNAYVP